MLELPVPYGIDPRLDVVFTRPFGEPAHHAGQVRERSGYADLRPVVGIWIGEEDAFLEST